MASLDSSILVDVLRRRSRFHQRALEKLGELQAQGEILVRALAHGIRAEQELRERGWTQNTIIWRSCHPA
jgi:predicted nucleic acid-binding protein